MALSQVSLCSKGILCHLHPNSGIHFLLSSLASAYMLVSSFEDPRQKLIVSFFSLIVQEPMTHLSEHHNSSMLQMGSRLPSGKPGNRCVRRVYACQYILQWHKVPYYLIKALVKIAPTARSNYVKI